MIRNRVEYNWIRDYYGERTAVRSSVPLIEHIHEGLTILRAIGADLTTQAAFCLHPLFQDDADLAKNYQQSLEGVDPQAILLTIEYRSIANQYLSHRQLSGSADQNADVLMEIQLSPLVPVNQMLIADKVQNRKDFELYHRESHPRADELTQYFANWLWRLEISEERYQELTALIQQEPN